MIKHETYIWKIPFLVFILSLGMPLLAKNVELIDQSVSANRIHIGDPVMLTLKLRSHPSIRLFYPDESLDVSPFLVLDRRIEIVEETESAITETFELKLSIYDTGDYDIPAIQIRYKEPDGQTEVLETEPVFIRVDSLIKTEDDFKPRDIKQPLDIDASLFHILITLLIGAAFLVVLWGLYLLVKRIRSQKTNPELRAEPVIPSGEWALKALENLDGKGLIKKGRLKEFYIELVELLKVYLEKRFGICAPERTTGELRLDLRSLALHSTHYHDLMELLELSDLIKFAKFEPIQSIAKESFAKVHAFVIATEEPKINETDPEDNRAVKDGE